MESDSKSAFVMLMARSSLCVLVIWQSIQSSNPTDAITEVGRSLSSVKFENGKGAIVADSAEGEV